MLCPLTIRKELYFGKRPRWYYYYYFYFFNYRKQFVYYQAIKGLNT